MKRWRDSLGSNFFAGSLFAVVWLVSAYECGAAGSWVMWCAGGITLYWVGSFAYLEWREREKRRRQDRKRERIAKRMMEQADKEFYIRNAVA